MKIVNLLSGTYIVKVHMIVKLALIIEDNCAHSSCMNKYIILYMFVYMNVYFYTCLYI